MYVNSFYTESKSKNEQKKYSFFFVGWGRGVKGVGAE